ncbi:MAG: phosphotransferase family protein [bacterium]|nr:phosphotransferase family protein [bacterium]
MRNWVEAMTGAPLVRAARHFAGASREAWCLDAGEGLETQPLFLLRDKGDGQGSARDAAVLRALAGSAVPVPEVVAFDPSRSLLLLERIPGRSDFPAVDQESEREPTAKHLMELTGQLHALEVGSLNIPHLELPGRPEDCALGSIEQVRAALRALGGAADPFFSFALDWLQDHVPSDVSRYSLVHSDMGPGNFLYQGGRVTGIVDWEVAHYGDPMEDLAAIAIRDMATAVGDLPTRFEEYRASTGREVDLSRVHYYRALVLVRNSLMIGLGLARPAPGFDVVEMTMYQTLLARAASLVLCDNLGIDRPSASASLPPLDGEAPVDKMRGPFLATMARDLAQTVAPAIDDPTAGRVCAGVGRGLEMLEHEERVGGGLDRRENDDLSELLGRSDRGKPESERALRVLLTGSGARDVDRAALARYFARRFHRLAERRRPLMGAFLDRLPQPLEAA